MVETIRKNIILFFACFCIIALSHAGNEEELFLRGNKYYAEKNYTAALHTYEMITRKGSAVLYNMGNCAFHQEDYSHALVYWNRAQKNATAHEYNLIERNKKIALQKLGHEYNNRWGDTIIRLLRGYMLISVLMLQLIFLVLWWLFMFVFCKKHTGIKKMMQACMCLTMFLCASLLTVHYVEQNVHQAIIVKKEARLLTGPDKSFHVLSPLNYAHNVRVKESREGWHKIQYADMIGWVEADVIQII